MPEHSNIVAAFFEMARRRGEAVCVRFKHHGRWRTQSWNGMARNIRDVAAGLYKLGLGPADRVAILADTCVEWTIADLAIMAAGGITVPIYHTLTVDRIAYILRDSAPSAIIVQGAKLRAVLNKACQSGGWMHEMPVYEMEEGRDYSLLAALAKEATPSAIQAIDRIVSTIAPSDDATYAYTSGTSGELKGAVITHENILSEIRATQKVFDFKADDVGLVCLPLAHVLGRLMQFYCLAQGCQAAYAEGIERLAENYLEIRPHFTVGVPRMLEKIHERAMLYVEHSSRWRRPILLWALAAGLRASSIVQRRQRTPLGLRASSWLADLLVLRRLRGRLGGRLRTFICGGAMLPKDVAQFFHAAGILVLEGYGLTETFAAATANRPDDYRFGTVGKPLPGVELKLATDGEILIRGPTVFKKYLNRPDETREAFDERGWFKTGDLGQYSRDGFLRITGRKKEIIITAGGKNISSQMVEKLIGQSPYVSHVMVYGDGRKYLTALITLNQPAVAAYLRQKGYAEGEEGMNLRHPAIERLISRHIEEQNHKLAPFETIKRFAILDEDFSVESGELTPTLKIRRDVVAAKYRDVLEKLY